MAQALGGVGEDGAVRRGQQAGPPGLGQGGVVAHLVALGRGLAGGEFGPRRGVVTGQPADLPRSR